MLVVDGALPAWGAPAQAARVAIGELAHHPAPVDVDLRRDQPAARPAGGNGANPAGTNGDCHERSRGGPRQKSHEAMISPWLPFEE